MSIRLCILILACAPWLGGCAEVVAKAPIGDTPVSIDEDDWEGIWVYSEGAIIINVLDEELGTLLVSIVDADDEPPTVEPMEVRLSETGGWLFGNWEEEPGEISWVRIERDGNTMLVWFPDFHPFKTLVDGGVLPGAVSTERGEKVVLDSLTAEHLEIITDSSQGPLFEWDEPAALFRVMGG